MTSLLLGWYTVHGRHNLPWRQTRDPYAVLISEVMLQQTQVDRVLPRYLAWLQRWPSAASLAQADLADVIREWSGLGYNRRAVNLHEAARLITSTGFPSSVAGLRALNGVGAYTAAAVASFAFELPVALADTNIARCLARASLGKASQRAVPPRDIASASAAWLPRDGTRDHNLALMDLGALVCRAQSPRCGECPLRETCSWRRAGFPDDVAPRRPAHPFKDTARYARGRIVDALGKSGCLTVREIAELLPPEHHARINGYLIGLQRDGLAERTPAGEWSLPVTRRVTGG